MPFSCSKCFIKKFRESAAESIIDPVAIFYGCRQLPQLRSYSCNFPYESSLNINFFLRENFSIAPHMLIIEGFFEKNFDYPEKPLKYKHIRRISD